MVHVKWNRDVLHFPVPPAKTLLGQLRSDIAEYTHLPPSSFKLIHAGAVMKDDSAPLSAYKIGENSAITLVGGHTVPAPSAPPSRLPLSKAKELATEDSTIRAIRAELDRVHSNLVPDVEAFVLACSNALASLPAPPFSDVAPIATPLSNGATSFDHNRLSELLLQSLLRLDAVLLPGVDWPDARQHRKAAVRDVQGILDRLDAAWASKRKEVAD